MTHRLGIIGGGNMGRAIVRGAIAGGVLEAGEIIVAEIDPARADALARLGCAVTGQARDVTGAAELMLAVKPQVFADVAAAIGPLGRSTVVISIMAGLGSGAIRRGLGDGARVVRVMPNTPCQVGEGMAAIALGEGAKRGDDALARALFGALGRTVDVTEDQMYAVTAVSGSGPAYVFLLAEAMHAAAVALGIEPATARTLVAQTIRGAGHLLTADEGADAAALRQAVTSPGGTTQAALDVMMQRDLPGIVVEALTAARDRGMALDEG